MLKDITMKPCGKRYIFDHNNGSKTAYLHYVDGMEIWEYSPVWKGWKLVKIMVGEKEVC